LSFYWEEEFWSSTNQTRAETENGLGIWQERSPNKTRQNSAPKFNWEISGGPPNNPPYNIINQKLCLLIQMEKRVNRLSFSLKIPKLELNDWSQLRKLKSHIMKSMKEKSYWSFVKKFSQDNIKTFSERCLESLFSKARNYMNLHEKEFIRISLVEYLSNSQ